MKEMRRATTQKETRAKQKTKRMMKMTMKMMYKGKPEKEEKDTGGELDSEEGEEGDVDIRI